MDTVITLISVGFYFLAIATIIPGLLYKTGIRVQTVMVSALAALALHGYCLYHLIFNGAAQNLSMLNVASAIGFITSIAMTLSMSKARLWFLMPIVYSFAILTLLAAHFVPNTFMTHLQDRPMLLLHIILALFAYTVLLIAALYSIQTAWIDNALKRKKQFSIDPNMPPLMLIERQLFNIILIGNLLLTVTLLSGYFFIEEIYPEGKTHKAVLSFLAWGVFSILLWGHYHKGWRGKKVTWLSILGVLLLTLGYFGSRFVNEVILI